MTRAHRISSWITLAGFLILLSPSAGLAAALSPEMLQLPVPTGPLPVGRAEFHWTDNSRTEPFASALSTRREVAVFVWYPAERSLNDKPAPYIPHYQTIAAAIGAADIADEFGNATAPISAGTLRSHSFADAPLKKSGRPFPVLVFSHGFGESTLTYSAQLEDLASHGYVVFGIEHPYVAYAVALGSNQVVPFAKAAWDAARARPKGAVAYQLAQIPLDAADIRFVIDQISHIKTVPGGARFAAALDLQRLGVFGHSLGGIAAASACRADARIRACMNEDADDNGRPFDGGPEALPIKQPFLFFVTSHSIYVSPRTPPPTDAELTNMKRTRAEYESMMTLNQQNQDRALAAMSGGAIRVMAEAPDFTHRTFIDLKSLQASDSAALQRQDEYLQIIRRYVRAFFDEALSNRPSPLLDRDGPVDSLITIEHFKQK